jgi:hypothetical protein
LEVADADEPDAVEAFELVTEVCADGLGAAGSLHTWVSCDTLQCLACDAPGRS